jgi:hypothetical protein
MDRARREEERGQCCLLLPHTNVIAACEFIGRSKGLPCLGVQWNVSPFECNDFYFLDMLRFVACAHVCMLVFPCFSERKKERKNKNSHHMPPAVLYLTWRDCLS